MMKNQAYQVKVPHVVYEQFEGEIVIVNLETGKYYSTRGSGAWVWSRLMHGTRLPELVAQSGAMPEPIESFVEQLYVEGLIVERQPETQAPAGDPEPPPAGFSAPSLERYNDMQDILLLDPIHDVDNTGWPQAIEPA